MGFDVRSVNVSVPARTWDRATEMIPSLLPSASEAFMMRFITTRRICAALARMAGRFPGRSTDSIACLEMDTCRSWSISLTSAERSSGSNTLLSCPA